MERPVIGIVPLVDIQRESYWMLPGYMDGVTEAGGLPLMLPLTSDEKQIDQLAALCDGFLFTGGQDVGPSLYGEEKYAVCGECCPERDAMEVKLLNAVLLQTGSSRRHICRIGVSYGPSSGTRSFPSGWMGTAENCSILLSGRQKEAQGGRYNESRIDSTMPLGL